MTWSVVLGAPPMNVKVRHNTSMPAVDLVFATAIYIYNMSVGSNEWDKHTFVDH